MAKIIQFQVINSSEIILLLDDGTLYFAPYSRDGFSKLEIIKTEKVLDSIDVGKVL